MLRGYAILKRSGSLDRLAKAQIALIEKPLNIPQEKIQKRLFGAAYAKANEAVRDFLFSRVGLYWLNKSLLISLGRRTKVAHPLPRIWRRELSALGWKVSEIQCALQWNGFLVCCIGYGLFLMARAFYSSFLLLFIQAKETPDRHVYFAGLTKNELPKTKTEKSFDVISWYLQWEGKDKKIKIIGHNVKNVSDFKYQNVYIRYMDPLQLQISAKQMIKNLLFASAAFILVFFDFLRGHWWSPLMFGPFVESFLIRSQTTLAVGYLFNNSSPRKPLWTYELDKKNIKTIFYFYSTNCDSFMTSKGYQPAPPYYRNMQWDRYLVWDEEQADFLRRSGNHSSQIEIAGPIWFSDSIEVLPEFSKKAVAVFDIQARRKGIYVWLGAPFEYYVPSTANAFLKEIKEVLSSLKYQMVWKPKRELPAKNQKDLGKQYQKLYSTTIQDQNILYVNPSTSAYKIILKSKAVVSMPFTSTALIARHLNKPACFYDPTGLIQKTDRASHGIPVISEKDKLFAWLNNFV